MIKIVIMIHAERQHCGGCEHRNLNWCQVFRTILATPELTCTSEGPLPEIQYERCRHCLDSEARVRDLEDIFASQQTGGITK